MRPALVRQWEIVQALSASRRGLTVAQLIEQMGTAQATFYRDLRVLQAAGVPLENGLVNGEARYSVWGTCLPPLAPTPSQIAALRLARRMSIGLDGTRVIAELDSLLGSYPFAHAASDGITISKQRPRAPDLVAKLDRAVDSQRCTRIRYRGARDGTSRWRNIDPLGLRYAKAHLYFVGYDRDRADYRTFKLERIGAVEVLAQKASPHPDFDIHSFFARSAKIWTGGEEDVVVRLSSGVARFVHEYPLVVDQSVHDQSDGAVVVRARVAGLPEAMRWVLSWGGAAEALEPKALREAVRTELERALGQYKVRVRELPAARRSVAPNNVRERGKGPRSAGSRTGET